MATVNTTYTPATEMWLTVLLINNNNSIRVTTTLNQAYTPTYAGNSYYPGAGTGSPLINNTTSPRDYYLAYFANFPGHPTAPTPSRGIKYSFRFQQQYGGIAADTIICFSPFNVGLTITNSYIAYNGSIPISYTNDSGISIPIVLTITKSGGASSFTATYNIPASSSGTDTIPLSSFNSTPSLGQYTGSVAYTANTYGVNAGLTNAIFTIQEAPPCFLPLTRILTPLGYRRVETLEDYDQIETGDGRSVPVKIYKTHIARTNQDTAPYCIPAGSIAPNVPDEDLHVSGLHAIQDANGMWQFPLGLAMHKDSRVQQHLPGRPATYYHLECPNYFTDNLVANNCVAESFRNKQGKEGITFEYCEAQQGFVRNREDEIKDASEIRSDVLAVYC